MRRKRDGIRPFMRKGEEMVSKGKKVAESVDLSIMRIRMY